MTVWEDPPERNTQFRRQLIWLNDLFTHPGEWGRYEREVDKSIATKLRKRYPEYEFEYRRISRERGHVWGRYVGVLKSRV